MDSGMGEFESRGTVEQAQPVATPKRKGNGGLKVLTVFLLLIGLALAAFIAVDKATPGGFLIANKEKEVKQEAKDEREASTPQAVGEKLGFAIWGDLGYLFVLKNGDVYYEPRTGNFTYGATDNMNADYDSAFAPGELGKYVLKEGDIDKDSYVPLEMDGEHYYPHEFTGYKLDVKNVRYVARAAWGQDFSGLFYALVDDEGKLSVLYLQPGNFVNNITKARASLVKNLEGFDGVRSVVWLDRGGGVGMMAVMEDGSQKMIEYDTVLDYKRMMQK